MISLNLNAATRWGLNLIALLSVVVALRLGETIFIPLVLAVLLAALLWPWVRWMNQTLRLPWSVACLVSVGILVLLNLLVTLNIAWAMNKIIQDFPGPHDKAGQEKLYSDIRQRLTAISPVAVNNAYFPEDAEDSRVFQYVQQSLHGPYVTDALWKVAWYGNNWLWQWVLILFILLFLLLEGRMLSRRLVEVVGPSPEAQTQAVEALTDMAHQVRSFLISRTLINIGLGLVVGAVYHAFGLRQAWTWALLTMLFCYVPYLGPIIAGVPPLIDAFVNCPSLWYVFGLLLFYMALITLEGYVVVPVVMGRSMELNATTVMLACLFWELVWGLPGLFMAMPLMAAIKAVCAHVPDLRPWANLMSTGGNGPPFPKKGLAALKVLIEDDRR